MTPSDNTGRLTVPVTVPASKCSACRRSIPPVESFVLDIVLLQISLSDCTGHVTGGSHRQRHDCQRWILFRRGSEATSIHDEEVFHFVCLAERVEDRCLGI